MKKTPFFRMYNMQRKILTILFFVAGFVVQSQTLQQRASMAYTAGNYEQAVEFYEQVLQEEGEAAALYYNLGNAYFKCNKMGKAILNYERALLLLPNYADARFNLKLAQEQTVDKIDSIGTFFLKRWRLNIQHLLSSDSWAMCAIILFLGFMGAMSLYFFTRKTALRKLGFYTALPLFVLCMSANYFAYQEKRSYIERHRAVIMEGSVSVKSTPNEEGTELFLLHEGTVVRVKNQLGTWREIEISDGNVGWIEEKVMEII